MADDKLIEEIARIIRELNWRPSEEIARAVLSSPRIQEALKARSALEALIRSADALLGCLNPVNLPGLKEQNYLALLDETRRARAALSPKEGASHG